MSKPKPPGNLVAAFALRWEHIRRHVAATATNHSVCTGRACYNKLSDSSRPQIASCVLVNSCANLCLSRQQVAQIQSDLLSCNFFRRQNSPVHTERFVVAATCCCNLSPSVFRPYGCWEAISFPGSLVFPGIRLAKKRGQKKARGGRWKGEIKK